MNYSWEILSTYFRDQGLAEMQIASFNEFIINGIQSVINSEPIIKSTGSGKEHTILLGDVFIDFPSIIGKNRNVKYITPQKARQKGIHYASSVCVNLVEIIKEQDETTRNEHFRIPICKIPIMLKSCKCYLSSASQEELPGLGECENDPGGYFVVNGLERVIVTQKRMNYNQVLVYKNEENKANKIKYKYYTETRSMSEETCHSIELKCVFGNDEKSIKFILPNITIRVPVGIVLKAMGFDKGDIMEMINLSKFSNIQKYLLYIQVDGKYITNKKTGETELIIKTQKDAIMYLSNFISPKYYQRFIKESTFQGNKKESWKKCKCIEKILSIEILPHLGIKQTFTEQGIFLTYIIRKLLLTVSGMRQTDNKDNIMNKRYQSTGILFTELFRSLYKKWIIDIREQLDKKGQDVIAAISKNNKMTENIKKCMLTEWGVKGNNWSMSGVSQIRASKNFADMISHLTRCVIPISKKGKNTDIRQINPSQFFFECLAETPEGQSVGIVTNLTPLTNITGRIDTFLVRDIIKELVIGIEEYSNLKEKIKKEISQGTYNEIADECEGVITPQDLLSYPYVFLNGDLLGFTDDPLQFVETVKHWRKIGYLHYTISIVYDRIDGEIRIFSDEGRLIRPLITVKNGRMEYLHKKGNSTKNKLTWDQLIENDYIRYLDPSEIETAQIVMNASEITKSTEYCEINPVLMWGLTANMVPFGNYSPSPRMSYVVSMIKQALGMPNLAHKNRADTISYVLDYPQAPMVQTKMGQITGYYQMPTGTNAIVAVATYKGMNTEDSIILNGSSLDRGLFSATVFKTYFTEERRIDNYSNEIIKLPSTKIRNHFNYDFLDEHGIVKVGSCLEVNDVIVGKVLYKSKEETEIDISVAVKIGETGIVDRVFVERNPDGYRVINVVIRKHLTPVIGDKFCTHKQKGTVGHIARQEDLPFSMATGMVPDVIINPHAFTSRMTVNVPLEMISGKIGAIKGEVMDGTSFNQPRELIDILTNELGGLGYRKQGFETMINGETGELLHAQIYMGISQYYRLKHLVEEKMHCLTLDHEVLTNRGWLDVRDIRPGDLVGILDPNTQELIYSPPEAILIYPAEKRKMYIIETEDISLYTTRNHKMYVKKLREKKYELIEADNLYSIPVKYKSNVKWIKIPFKYDNIDDLFITDNFLILTAVYIMYGTQLDSGVEISFPNLFIKSLTIGSLNNLKIFCYTFINENTIQLNRFSKDLVKATKLFNELIFQLDSGQCRILLKIFFHVSKEVIMEKTLADSVQILCLHAGYNCRYSVVENSTESMGGKKEKVKITLIKNKKEPNTKYGNVIMEKRVIDTVPVFCLTVKGGVFYVRRNGKSVFTGNSRKSGHLNALTRQPVAGRQRAGGLKFGNMETECVISQSAAAFLKERLFSTSDPFQIKMCNDCGCDTVIDNECINCKGNDIKTVIIPFATKLLHTLLKTMCIKVKPEVL
jgi:DNA-directed RNA polymerase II subunit RPB2